MSVSYSAQVFWGMKVSSDDLVSRKPNPKFDPKTPFNARTGEKIPEFLEKHMDAEDLAAKFKVETISNGDDVLFGTTVSDDIDLNYDSGVNEFTPPTEKEQAEIKVNIDKLFAHLGLITIQRPRFFLVTSVG